MDGCPSGRILRECTSFSCPWMCLRLFSYCLKILLSAPLPRTESSRSIPHWTRTTSALSGELVELPFPARFPICHRAASKDIELPPGDLQTWVSNARLTAQRTARDGCVDAHAFSISIRPRVPSFESGHRSGSVLRMREILQQV